MLLDKIKGKDSQLLNIEVLLDKQKNTKLYSVSLFMSQMRYTSVEKLTSQTCLRRYSHIRKRNTILLYTFASILKTVPNFTH